MRRNARRPGALLAVFAVLWLGLLGSAPGCGKKASEPSGPPPEITGLAAVPSTAEVVIGANIAKLVDTPVIDRAVDQLLLRNAVLSERWQRLRDDCKVDFGRQIKRVMLAIGPHTGPEPGTGPVLMVVVGSIPEADLKECVVKFVGHGGGTVTGQTVYGRTLYLAKDGNRAMYFAYGRPDTIVLGADEAFVTEALGTGKKAPDNADLARWLKLVNQNSSVWAAGRTDARIRGGLVRFTEGKLREGPVAYTASADLLDGANLQFGVVMASPEDAKGLESYVNGEKALLTAAAQLKSLGSVVAKITVAVEGNVVKFRAPLTVEDLNQLLSVLDGGSPPAQDSAPPAPGSGSGTPEGSGAPVTPETPGTK
jgi:hypothetical protein